MDPKGYPAKKLRGLSVAVAVAGLLPTALSQTFVWDNEKGDYLWFEGMNWDPDGVPSAGADVLAEADDVIVAASQLIDLNSVMSTGPGLRLTGLASLRVASLSEIAGLILDTSIVTPLEANGPLSIVGNSEFNATPVFTGGDEVSIGGTALFTEGFFADTLTSLSGEITLDPIVGAPGGSAIARSDLVVVTGKVILREGGTIASQPSGRWRLEGELTNAPGASGFSTASLTMPEGTIRASDGTIRVSGATNCSGNVIAENGGEIILEGGVDFYSNPVFSGDGIVRIRASATLFSLTNQMTGPTGLSIEAPFLEMGGNLVSTGTLSIRNTQMTGPGVLQIGGGIARTVVGGPFLAATGLTGGTFEVAHSTRFNTEFRIEGGTLDLKLGAALGDSTNGFPVRLVSGAITMAPELPSNTIVDIRSSLDVTGGTLLLEGGQLRARNGTSWSGGDVSFGTTDAGALFLGGFIEHTFNGGTSVSGRGILDLGGPTSGDRPTINVNADLDVGIGGPDDRNVFTRVRTRLTGAGQLTNTGYLRFEGVPRLENNFFNAGVTTLASSLTVEGQLVNAGVWEHENSMTVNGAAITNTGLWSVTKGGSINDTGFTGSFTNATTYVVGGQPTFFTHGINTPFNNVGVLQVSNAEVSIAFTEQIDDQGRLTGGNWSCGANGRIRFQDTITEVTGPQTRLRGRSNELPETRNTSRISDGATREITGDSSLTPAGGTLTLDDATLSTEVGTTSVPELELESGATLEVAPDARLESQGPIRVGEPPVTPGQSVIDDIVGVVDLARLPGRSAGQTGASPTVAASQIDLHGRLIPGDEGVIGSLRLEAPVTAFESATWLFDVGVLDADALEITGPVTLGGTLRVSQLAELEQGDEFVLVSASAGLTGSFDAIEIESRPGQNLMVSTTPTEVRLTAACPADLALPVGIIDLDDLDAFIAAFLIGGSSADLVAPFGIVDLDDIDAFIAFFLGGCAS